MSNNTFPAADCALCPRLVTFRQKNQQQYPEFYNGAVPSFGASEAELLIVGLAPGLKGANATARPFTGDYAGDLLYPALARHGFTQDSEWLEQGKLPSELFRSVYKQPRDIPFELKNARITNAVRCVPPENKPTTQEINECNIFLTKEICSMPRLKVMLTLGLVSHKAVLKALGYKQSAFTFAHGASHHLRLGESAECIMVNSYHTSRYNVNTGRLTLEMFDEVIKQCQHMISKGKHT